MRRDERLHRKRQVALRCEPPACINRSLSRTTKSAGAGGGAPRRVSDWPRARPRGANHRHRGRAAVHAGLALARNRSISWRYPRGPPPARRTFGEEPPTTMCRPHELCQRSEPPPPAIGFAPPWASPACPAPGCRRARDSRRPGRQARHRPRLARPHRSAGSSHRDDDRLRPAGGVGDQVFERRRRGAERSGRAPHRPARSAPQRATG